MEYVLKLNAWKIRRMFLFEPPNARRFHMIWLVFSHGNVSLFPFKPFSCQVATVDFTAWYVQKDMPKSLLLLILSLKVTWIKAIRKRSPSMTCISICMYGIYIHMSSTNPQKTVGRSLRFFLAFPLSWQTSEWTVFGILPKLTACFCASVQRKSPQAWELTPLTSCVWFMSGFCLVVPKTLGKMKKKHIFFQKTFWNWQGPLLSRFLLWPRICIQSVVNALDNTLENQECFALLQTELQKQSKEHVLLAAW